MMLTARNTDTKQNTLSSGYTVKTNATHNSHFCKNRLGIDSICYFLKIPKGCTKN
jgi:hypothetical protein